MILVVVAFLFFDIDVQDMPIILSVQFPTFFVFVLCPSSCYPLNAFFILQSAKSEREGILV